MRILDDSMSLHANSHPIIGLVFIELFIWPFLFMRKYRRLNQQPGPHHGPSPENYDPRTVFNRFTQQADQLGKYMCIKNMMRQWFYDREASRRDVADLLCYGFWFKSREQLAAEGQGHLPDQLVDEIESAWGVKFKLDDEDASQSSPLEAKDHPFMAHLWQEIRCHYRPFIFYLVIEFLFLFKHVAMSSVGFTSHRIKGQVYYMSSNFPHRTLKKDEESIVPFLFLHGVGLGLLPYLSFVFRLLATGRPVLCLESPHLGMRWVDWIPSEEEVTEIIVEILDKHQIDQVSCTAHSYGTFFASRLVQRFKSRVHSLVLIDPVAFVMFSGKLVSQFVYKAHEAKILTWLVARDIHHAASVCRRFYWAQLNLWPDHLPKKTLVVLSGKDELVPVEESLIMLREEAKHARVMFHEDHEHADFIKPTEPNVLWQGQVVEETLRMLSSDDDEDEVCDEEEEELPAARGKKEAEPRRGVTTRSQARKMKEVVSLRPWF